LNVSIIVLNYNGLQWIDRCVDSIQAQTMAASCEVIFADNASSDGSREYLKQKLRDLNGYRYLTIEKNIGFGGGCNEAAKFASGKYLFFLNPDVWLEPDCIELLFQAAEKFNASAASALVLDYHSDAPQSWGGGRYDIFGIGTPVPLNDQEGKISGSSCFFFIHKDVFNTIGEFDPEFFLYNEEQDINMRLNLLEATIINVPRAHIHHQGTITLSGEARVRTTSADKRFYSNRNHLLSLLKCAHSALYLFIANSLVLFFVEALAGMLLWPRLGYFKRTFTDVIKDCWKLRQHINRERMRISQFRKKSDWALLKDFTWRLNRFHHLRDFYTNGFPKMR
jgi:GT2 family glycosyltransferase